MTIAALHGEVLPSLTNHQFRQQVIERNPQRRLMLQMEQIAQPGDRILFIDDRRTFYARRTDHEHTSLFDPGNFNYLSMKSTEDLITSLQERNITLLVVNSDFLKAKALDEEFRRSRRIVDDIKTPMRSYLALWEDFFSRDIGRELLVEKDGSWMEIVLEMPWRKNASPRP